MTRTNNGVSELLPDPAPFFVFFLPNLWGIILAVAFEYVGLEETVAGLLPSTSHPFALLGLAFLALAIVSSYLTGCVVCARIEYGVKLPNLYADKKEHKDAVQYNCIQRGHQNLIENMPQYVSSAFLTSVVAGRPNVAGVMLLVVAVARFLYGMGYKKDVKARFPPFLLAQFAGSVGIGYGVLMAVSILGWGPFVISQ